MKNVLIKNSTLATLIAVLLFAGMLIGQTHANKSKSHHEQFGAWNQQRFDIRFGSAGEPVYLTHNTVNGEYLLYEVGSDVARFRRLPEFQRSQHNGYHIYHIPIGSISVLDK